MGEINFDKIEAGRETDVMVAEHVMGWPLVILAGNGQQCFRMGTPEQYTLLHSSEFQPSTKGTDALLVLERLRVLGFDVGMKGNSGYEWGCFAWPMGTAEDAWNVKTSSCASAKTFCLAACRTALKATAEVKR